MFVFAMKIIGLGFAQRPWSYIKLQMNECYGCRLSQSSQHFVVKLTAQSVLDGGSSTSFFQSILADELGTREIKSQEIGIGILGGVSKKFKGRIFTVMVESMNGRFSNKFHFHTICGICSFLSTEGDPWIYFDLYDFADEYPLQSAEANLLMGQDYYWEIVRNKFILNSLTSTSCLLSNAELSRHISSYFMLESLGINSISHEAEIYCVLDQMALDQFKQSVKFDKKRYTIEEDRGISPWGSRWEEILNYMPLSAIFKEKSISTKVMIVFDPRTLNKKKHKIAVVADVR
ncbi:unnamed protein product [Lepeophtheirus salmonis]|uniref:(salmon louse) hypothetical protein n=1 Tax=Lepeophtheirus salmonis TaxID=72036 RepID=A0A7R8H2I1_LEPSM|nr:unnamed protein product [Lepeophtheirus salmonis]CAF2813763.1 unnamed protein product [Lepeophtheirus salmonis]